jgi:hypothetical protein
MNDDLDYLLKEYKDRMTMLSEALARGNAASFEEYRYICGQLRGLEAACSIIIDLKQKMEHSDNE